VPDEDGLLWITADDARDAVAHEAPDDATRIAATQKPIAVKCLGEAMGPPAWREKPSWFLVAENDRMIASETQRWLAARMGSTVKSVVSDHVPLFSHADAIVELIVAAACS
jgi:hypothetical protein